MNILSLMGLFPHEYEEEINQNSIGGIQNAANKFQWGIVNGLSQIDGVDLKIINSLYIGSYPKRYKKCYIPSFSFQHDKDKNSQDINVGFINLSIYKSYSRYSSIKKEIKKAFCKEQNRPQVVIAYAMTTPFVELLAFIKKEYPQTICCLIVPDLPEYMNAALTTKKAYQFAKKMQISHFKRKLKKIDGYVLLTKYMREWFDWSINYTVIEGISLRTKKDLDCIQSKQKEKVILYAGMIEEKYGVLDLVKAFMRIDNPEWILELYGNGSTLSHIEKLAYNDKRIKVKGNVPNEQIIKRQQEVSLLVNPRNDSNEFTKYSFPSKIIEYMGSGTPMLGYKLSGMPDEYLPFFFLLEPGIDGMAKSIQQVISLSDEERAMMGRKALEFIISKKNAKKQCEKIISLITSCMNEG